MPDLDSPLTSYLSPKRKRDDHDTAMVDAPSPSRLRTTNLPIRSLIEDEAKSEGSPRTCVAGHLEGLDLDAQNEIPQLQFDKTTELHVGKARTGFGSSTFDPRICLPSQTYEPPVTPPLSSHGPLPVTFQANATDTPMPLEIPETPRLRPVSSPTPPPSATKLNPSKSPPATPSAQALWWDDSEITGHDPKDPTDDGYGINGVGFLPTPAIANARAERRKKQVAEWKLREAREARQKRSDRRRRRDLEMGPVGNPTVRGENCSKVEEGRKVRFLEV